MPFIEYIHLKSEIYCSCLLQLPKSYQTTVWKWSRSLAVPCFRLRSLQGGTQLPLILGLYWDHGKSHGNYYVIGGLLVCKNWVCFMGDTFEGSYLVRGRGERVRKDTLFRDLSLPGPRWFYPKVQQKSMSGQLRPCFEMAVGQRGYTQAPWGYVRIHRRCKELLYDHWDNITLPQTNMETHIAPF